MGKHAVTTGITGQDGSDLAERALAAGSEVHGPIRRASPLPREGDYPVPEQIAAVRELLASF